MRNSTAALHEPTHRIAAVSGDPRQVISAAISGDGEPIEPTFRSALEARFGTDLAGVQVHRSAASDAANAMLGSLAFTVDDHIVLRRGFDERCGPAYCHVLAHETAHVMQKRLARSLVGLSPLADESLLEAEADRIAAEIIRGDPVLKMTPDPAPMTIRRWGVAGHYWTIYFACMAAGSEQDAALNLALFAQMPDQVDELDATEAGKNLLPSGIALVIPGNYAVNHLLSDRNIQRGLHALTGRDANFETETRLRTLRGAAPSFSEVTTVKAFEFGLGLHPFGDSYAHRRLDTNTMYAFGVGHLVEAAHIEGGGLRNPHVPDFVNRRPPLYREYGLAMFDLFVELWDQRPEIEREKFGNYLDEVSGIRGDLDQIRRIGLICAGETFTVTSDYRPEFEPLRSWTKFRSAHPDPPSDLLLRAAKCAEMWAG